MPPFLQLHPELQEAIMHFGEMNIDTIDISIMNNFINRCIKIIVDRNADFYDLSNDDEKVQTRDPEESDGDVEEVDLDDGFEITSYDLREEFVMVMKNMNTELGSGVGKVVGKIASNVPANKRRKLTKSKNVIRIRQKLKISPTTTVEWMKKLGFRYGDNLKNFYVDSHEKIENVRYRVKFA